MSNVTKSAPEAMQDFLSNREKVQFETTLEKLGRVISRQYNVSVQFEGNQAQTDGQTIYLPTVDRLTRTLKQDLNGFLDSSVGSCRYTDFPELKKPTKRFAREMLSVVETARVEGEMVQEYPGCALHLDPMNERLAEKIKAKWESYPAPIRIIFGVRDLMQGREPQVDDDTARYLEAVRDEAQALGECRSTREVAEAVTRIVKVVEEERERELSEDEEEGEEGEEGTEGEGGGKGMPSDALDWEDKQKPSKGGEGGEGGEGVEQSAEGGEQPPEKPKDEQPQGDGKLNEDPEGKQAKGRGKNQDQKDQKDQKGKGDGSSPKAEKGEREPNPEFDEMLNEGKDQKDSKFNDHLTSSQEMVNEQLKDNLAKSPPADKRTKGGSPFFNEFDYRPSIAATTRFDKIIDETGSGDSARYAAAKTHVQRHVGTIQRVLERTLKVKENAHFRLERERGRINAAALGKMAADPNYRTPFKDFRRADTTNVAVGIVIDMSGSMHGSKIQLATEAAIAMSEALANLGINFEVTGFHSEGDAGLRNFVTKMQATGQDVSRFNRTQERIDLHVFKTFDNPRLHGLTQIGAYGNNTDGESVRMAAKRLGAQRQRRKVLIVMSDGLPHDAGNPTMLNADLEKTVRDLKVSGIECVGIGIQSDAVKRFYPECVIIQDIQDLPQEAMAKLAAILLKGGEKVA